MRKGHVIYCNRCGRQLKGTDGTPVEEGLHVEKSWDIFRGKTGEIQSFDLCESCYDLLVQDFRDSTGEKRAENFDLNAE